MAHPQPAQESGQVIVELLVAKLVLRSDSARDRSNYFVQWKVDRHEGRTLATPAIDGLVVWSKLFRTPPIPPPTGATFPITLTLLKEKQQQRPGATSVGSTQLDLNKFMNAAERQEYHVPFLDSVLEIRLKVSGLDQQPPRTRADDSLEDTLTELRHKNEELEQLYERGRSRLQNAGAPPGMDRDRRSQRSMSSRSSSFREEYRREPVSAPGPLPSKRAGSPGAALSGGGVLSSDDEQFWDNRSKLSREAAEYKRLLEESIRREEMLSNELQRVGRSRTPIVDAGTQPRDTTVEIGLPPYDRDRPSRSAAAYAREATTPGNRSDAAAFERILHKLDDMDRRMGKIEDGRQCQCLLA